MWKGRIQTLIDFNEILQADEVINSMDGSLYKLQCALAQVSRQETPSHRLSSYIQSSKDKQVQNTVPQILTSTQSLMASSDMNIFNY